VLDTTTNGADATTDPADPARIRTPVTDVRFVPDTDNNVPAIPVDGDTDDNVGTAGGDGGVIGRAITKSVALDTFGTPGTESFPVFAACGTTTVTSVPVPVPCWGVVVPANSRSDGNPVPVTVTVTPTYPAAGENPEITGITRNP